MRHGEDIVCTLLKGRAGFSEPQNIIDMTGDLEDRNFIVTRGDARIAMTIAKNEYTVKFGRESRFLIDDDDSEEKLSYVLSKPLRVGWHYNGEGVYLFVLRESNSTEDDNMKLGIANYYKYFPREDEEESDTDSETDAGTDGSGETQTETETADRKGWL